MDDNFLIDLWIESWIEDLFITAENEKLAKKGIWKDKESNELKISEMSTSHIKNCINFIKRNNFKTRLCYLEVFQDELSRREQQTTFKKRNSK